MPFSKAEAVFRLSRGEGMRVLSADMTAMRERLNSWLSHLIKWRATRKKKQADAVEKEQKKQKVAAAVAGAHAAAASSSSSLPQAPLPSNAAQQDDLKYGCSKCKWAPTGCLACCAAKAARYGQGKLEKSQAKLDESQA